MTAEFKSVKSRSTGLLYF